MSENEAKYQERRNQDLEMLDRFRSIAYNLYKADSCLGSGKVVEAREAIKKALIIIEEG